jgi:hypothetical protein
MPPSARHPSGWRAGRWEQRLTGGQISRDFFFTTRASAYGHRYADRGPYWVDHGLAWAREARVMRRFPHAVLLAAATSAPVLMGVLTDHSAVSVLGAPGSGCSGSCTVGSAGNGGINSDGKAQGFHVTGQPVESKLGGTFSESGTVNTGRFVRVGGDSPGSQSGNFTTGAGHCTGTITC